MSDTLNRLPASVDTERIILGAVVLDDIGYATAVESLKADDFSVEKHRRIFRRMGELYARGQRVDRVTVAEELTRHGELDAVGGLTYLASLDDGLPRVPSLDSYVRIVKDKSARRRIMFACQNLTARCTVAGEDLQEIIAEGQRLLDEIGTQKAQGYRSIADIPTITECGARKIEYIREPELPKGAVVALTGDSGSGKSTLVTAWARDIEVPVLFLDRENPLSVIADRLARLGVEDAGSMCFWGGWLEAEAPLPDAAVVVDWVKTRDPKPLVVVDSLAAFHGGDQNDAGEMRTFMHRCRRLADLGATVVVIHHDGKSETAKDYRGSSDFKAAIDLGLHVSNFGADGHLDKLVLRPFKARMGFNGEQSYAYAGGQFVRGDSGQARETIADQLTTLLLRNPGITARKFDDLVKECGIGRDRARSFLGDGVLSGAIRKETGTKNEKRYYLAVSACGL